jgi:sugar phosphate isomerase/epimerase
MNRTNAKLQFDSLHLYRAGFTAADIAKLSPSIVGRAQLSDGPAEMPIDRQFDEALSNRLVPGDGELPLAEFLKTLPGGTVVGIEVPMGSLQAQGIGPEERVHRAVVGARSLSAPA